MQVKGYSNEDKFIVLTSQGMNAFMLLTSLLWNDKTDSDNAKVEYNTVKKTITIVTKQFTYEFTNVPLQWGGGIDTHTVYAQHYQKLLESEVI